MSSIFPSRNFLHFSIARRASAPSLSVIPFEAIGVAVFALTGALVAARKGMDPFGFALLAIVTGIGGGTVRVGRTGR